MEMGKKGSAAITSQKLTDEKKRGQGGHSLFPTNALG